MKRLVKSISKIQESGIKTPLKRVDNMRMNGRDKMTSAMKCMNAR